MLTCTRTQVFNRDSYQRSSPSSQTGQTQRATSSRMPHPFPTHLRPSNRRRLPPLLASSSKSSTPTTPHNDTPSLVTYRHYATLYFIVISTSTESPLALLDLIQVFVQALDGLFENVCELDLIFNFETLHATLGELIVGGVVVETQLDKVVEGVKAQGRVAKRPVNEGKGGLSLAGFGRGDGVWAGR